MRTFLLLDNKYHMGKLESCVIKGCIQSDNFPSGINNDKERFPQYYDCCIIEVTENCHINLL